MKIPARIAIGSTALFGAVIAFAASSSLSAPTTAPARGSYKDYAVIVEKNIFMRDRSRTLYTPGSRPSYSPTTQHFTKSLEETLVLTGIVFEDGEYHAYVEDTSADKIQRLAGGDDVAHGKITGIEIDAVLYQPAGKAPQWIDIGSDFTGHPYAGFTDSSGESTSSSGTPSTGPASSQPAINPNDPNLTVEQRMRLRAQQQQRSGRR
jgi:hypothetical protein